MHKILLNDNAKTYIEHQRRLNPVMKEIVRKEVLKWLDAGFIYAISDSSWVRDPIKFQFSEKGQNRNFGKNSKFF